MNWKTVEDFAAWYKTNRFPIRPPFEDPIYVTDISYSYVLFREGQFQVELYLVKPNTFSPEHCHPGVENIVMVWGGDIGTNPTDIVGGEPTQNGTSSLFGARSQVIKNDATHALHAGEKGCAVISIEKWPEGVTPTSVSIRWRGDTCGDVHTKLVDDENIL